jgi:hypothetical protein
MQLAIRVRTAAIVQDLADSLLALNDIRGAAPHTLLLLLLLSQPDTLCCLQVARTVGWGALSCWH